MTNELVEMPIKCTLRQLMAEENLRRAKQGEPALSQQQLARETGLPPSVINGLVTGRSQRVDFGTLEKLCKRFNVQPGEILVWEEVAS